MAGSNYGYTGKGYEGYINLLHLRARWYLAETGTFLSRDAVESEPPYAYVRGNPINRIDPSGKQGDSTDPNRPECYQPVAPGDIRPVGCTLPPECYAPLPAGDIYNPFNCPAPPAGYPPTTSRPYPSAHDIYPPGELALAVAQSHFQMDDGVVFGISGMESSYIRTFPSIQGLMIWDVVFNGCNLPDSGVTGGVEIVYDFKHQERGRFTYSGPLFNLGSISTGGVSIYTGRTRGFANPANTYRIGVDAYGGYFASTAVSVGIGKIPVSFGGSVTEAAPLNKNRQLNPNGVFATYSGRGGGVGFGLPVNIDIAVTNYTLVEGSRERYITGISEEEIIRNKRDSYVNRMTAAARMGSEINQLMQVVGGPFSQPGSFVATAWPNLWLFALDTSP